MYGPHHGTDAQALGPDHRVVVLDLDHLQQQALGDEEVVKEVLGMFMDQSADMLRVIREASTWRDRRDGAHRLKGSARALGAFRVADAAERLERMPDEADEATLLDALASLHAAVAEARAAVAGALAGGETPRL